MPTHFHTTCALADGLSRDRLRPVEIKKVYATDRICGKDWIGYFVSMQARRHVNLLPRSLPGGNRDSNSYP
jgi:hypothetical protein